MPVETKSCDVVVIGAGPSGSAAAAVLAERGRRVVLVEKAPFPRYSVGESLIPHCWYPLDRLGLVQRLDASSFIVRKYSVQFASLDGELSTPFYFFDHTDHDCARTWQVLRSEFDQLLLDNALERGAAIERETTAERFLREDGAVVGVRCRRGDGTALELRAPVTIDASGRQAFAQGANGWRVADEKLKKMSIWTYYVGALRDPGKDEGATTIAYLPAKGWFWYIPLACDTVSVGVVADREYLFRDSREPEAIFQREVRRQPWIARHLAPGRPTGEYRVTSDFTYRSRHCAEDGLVLAGDAFAFLDPVFSSGVFLALQGGVMAGDAVEAALAAGDTSAGRFREYGERFCAGMEAMRRLVHAFYDQEFNFGDFLEKYPHHREELTDCLVGNLWRDFDDFFRAVSEFAPVPEPLPHGMPLLRGDAR